MKKRHLSYLKFTALILISACTHHLSNSSPIATVTDQSKVDPAQVLIQKLGGPLGYDLEIENYLKRVFLRLGTLTTFREQEVSIQIVNHSGIVCLFFENKVLILSRGLLVSLNNEAELVAAITKAMLTKTSFNAENNQSIANLADEIAESDFMEVKKVLSRQTKPFDVDRCEEILASLGYSKSGVKSIIQPGKITLLGLESLEPKERNFNPSSEYFLGYLGEASYQKIISPLKLLQPSYDLEDLSIELLKNKQLNEALENIHKAIQENPAEGHFYYTLSKILMQLNKIQQALKAIEQAVKLNNFNVLFYLQRAKLYEILSETKEAHEDFRLANELLLISQVVDLNNS